MRSAAAVPITDVRSLAGQCAVHRSRRGRIPADALVIGVPASWHMRYSRLVRPQAQGARWRTPRFAALSTGIGVIRLGRARGHCSLRHWVCEFQQVQEMPFDVGDAGTLILPTAADSS